MEERKYGAGPKTDGQQREPSAAVTSPYHQEEVLLLDHLLLLLHGVTDGLEVVENNIEDVVVEGSGGNQISTQYI